MSRPRVTVIDSGIGNLYSVCRALEHCGAEPVLSDDPRGIDGSQRLVLPGVGAFGDGMQGLAARGLVEPIRAYAASGRPLLGICLGMQMLASSSEEFGSHAGLGLIPGRVRAIPALDAGGRAHKIPAIGWQVLEPAADWRDTPLATCEPGASTYFVHSFHFEPDDERRVLARYRYGGHPITAAVAEGRIVGVQFHPEKSGPVGLRILESFVRGAAGA
jgi:glutamine amidotransferase